VIYACREYACSAIDVLARRLRLAFLNVHAAEEALPRVIEIMARELGWNASKQKACIHDACLSGVLPACLLIGMSERAVITRQVSILSCSIDLEIVIRLHSQCDNYGEPQTLIGGNRNHMMLSG